MFPKRAAALLMLLLLLLARPAAFGQGNPITVTGSEPRVLVVGQGGILSVFGTNFTDQTVVRLEGIGVLPTTLVNPGVVTVAIPAGAPAGVYTVLVLQPGQPPTASPDTLTIIAPTFTPAPPTSPPPAPPTSPPPTLPPGAPNVLVRTFSASPQPAQPGGAATFSIELVNTGTRPAQGLVASLEPGGKFIPASGQASILLPDLGVGASAVFSLGVVVAQDAAAGPQTVSLNLSYRDFTGESYTGKGVLTLVVGEAPPTITQVTLARYLIDPNPVEPGKPVKVTVLLTNSGTAPAKQVLFRIDSGGALLAGPQGDSFPIGDLPPGGSASLELPLIVSTTAKPGPQPQTFTISYLQGSEAKQQTGSFTVPISSEVASGPVLLLEQFDIGRDILAPGDVFTADIIIKNVGREAASNALIAFGVTEIPSGGETGGAGTGTGTGGDAGARTTFAPLGSGGAVFAGAIEADGGTFALQQQFIVNGSVESGIYTLPIAVRYQKSDGSSATDNLRASLVVVVPPKLNLTLETPLPPEANVGEPLFLTLKIANRGTKAVNFTDAAVEADNGEVIEGAEQPMSPLRTDDETTVAAGVIPLETGEVTIRIKLNYTDDLNKPQTITQSYTLPAVIPPTPEPIDPGIDPFLPPVDGSGGETDGDDLLGRLLLGLLGLGS